MTLDDQKHESILAVVSALTLRLGGDAFHIVDHWDADRCAIGIASPECHGVLVYISTLKQPGRFCVSLELPPDSQEDFPYKDAGSMEAVSIEELVEIVRKHLDTKING